MFRDRDEELDRLEAALQEAEEEEDFSEEEEYEEDCEEDCEEEFDLPDFDAYNSDITNGDLEEYAEEVYEGRKKSRLGLLAFLLVVLCIVLAILAWCLLKYGGYLG